MVYESKHPLVKHKLTLMRNSVTKPKKFRELIREISMLLCYEATTDLTTQPLTVDTPMGRAEGVEVQHKVGLVPILRAGLGMVEGIWEMMPGAEVWHIGLYRDERTLKPVSYYNKLPTMPTVQVCLVLDPMLATGGSAVATVDILKKWGAERIKFVGILAAPEGVARLQTAHPDVDIHVAHVDERLNDIGYIVPGLGMLATGSSARVSMVYLIVVVASAAAAFVATPLARRLSFQLGVVAEPGGRRLHQGRIPKLGGLAVAVGWAVGVALTYLLLPPDNPDDALRLRGVVLGSLVVVAGGLLDDRYDLPPWAQLLIQLLGALVAILHIIFIEVFTNPLPGPELWQALPLFSIDGQLVEIWRPLALLFTTFWIIGMINAINFLDGLDGLAAGVCLIAAAFFAYHSWRLAQTTVPLFPLALAGALLGFLPFNFSPARIFLGSAGAYFLGYQMATLSILAPAKLSTALLVLAVPIIDVAWQAISRIRQGRHPMVGDRGHLHFRLADSGLPTPRIVLGYYGVALVFGLAAVLAASPLVKLALLAALAMGVLALLLRLSHK